MNPAFAMQFQPAVQQYEQSPWVLVPLVLAIVCVVRRKQAIGGWLLWFLSGIVLSGVVTVISAAVSYRNYLPGASHDTKLYLIYVLTRVPAHIASIAVAVMAVQGARGPSPPALRWLSAALGMRVALGLIMLAADRAFFPTLLIPDLRNVAAAVWVLAYLWLSVRVDRVFCKQNWA